MGTEILSPSGVLARFRSLNHSFKIKVYCSDLQSYIPITLKDFIHKLSKLPENRQFEFEAISVYDRDNKQSYIIFISKHSN